MADRGALNVPFSSRELRDLAERARRAIVAYDAALECEIRWSVRAVFVERLEQAVAPWSRVGVQGHHTPEAQSTPQIA